MKNQVILNPLNASCDQPQDPLGLIPLPAETRERFLRFTLAKKNNVLVPLTRILEVMQLPLPAVLPVPDVPHSVVGICSWQGKTLWVVDLNILAGYAPLFEQVSGPASGQISDQISGPSQQLTSPVVIVVQYEARSLGLMVEKVGDVDLIDPAAIHHQLGLCPVSLEPFVLGHCPQMQGQDGGMVLNISAIVNSFRD